MINIKAVLHNKDPFIITKRLLITLCIVIMLFFIADFFNVSSFVPIYLRFDWAYDLCTLVAAVASVTLCAVTLKQNETANQLNKYMYDMSRENFKKSIVKDAYSLLRFHADQFMSSTGDIMRINFKDEKGLPLKLLKISSISFEFLNDAGTAVIGDKIILKNTEESFDLEYTPNKEPKDDYYLVNIKLDESMPDIAVDQRARIGFSCELENFFGVKTSYRNFYIIIRATGVKRLEMNILKRTHEFCYFDKLSYND